MRRLSSNVEAAAATGGWFCYGACQRWTDLDLDREQNVCFRCGRPTVRWLPPPRLVRARRPVSVERGRELFEAMRKAL